MPLTPTAFDRDAIGAALLEELVRQGEEWRAVRVRGGTLWEIVTPRSQEALLAACETEEPSEGDS